MLVVPAAGRSPNLVLLVGEAPGREEASKGQPFVGKAGAEQEWYLSRRRLSAKFWRRTNVVPEFTPGNPDPTLAQIRRWSPVLEVEVAECAPSLIVAVGRFAARWFLGEEADLEVVHGIPHWAGTFDSRRAHRGGPANKGRGALILPVYHPALGFHNNDARALIDWDYGRVAEVLSRIEKGRSVEVPHDDYPECYLDVGGEELAEILAADPPSEIGVDTEGTSEDVRISVPWSIQVATAPGLSYVLRCKREDFDKGIAALRSLLLESSSCTVLLHNAMYDIEMCRRMGLDLSHPTIPLLDTMYAAYLLRLEPQGLKPLSWRWCGMRMDSYTDIVGGIARERQLDYLIEVSRRDWPKPEPEILIANDGTTKLRNPQPVDRRALKIVEDICSDKVNKDGEFTDPVDRWSKVDDPLRAMVETELGPMPIATLADVESGRATRYAARDADATLRLHTSLLPELTRKGLSHLYLQGGEITPVFEEMQSGGMPASRKYFEDLSESLTDELLRLGARISYEYLDGETFNPKSGPQVAKLLKKRGLKGAKKTRVGGEISTAKDSIEHLRYTDPAISAVFEWREMQHVRDSFCAPVLAAIPEGEDIYPVRCQLRVTRTATRRLAASDPNLLNIPSRTDIGKKVRDGYICPPGYVYLASDLSQIEARCMAHESEDQLMCSFFREGRDIHTETAARIFGVGLSDVTSEQRRSAKTANFGIIYGIMPMGLVTQLWMMGQTNWTEESAEELIGGILGVFSGVAKYIDEVTTGLARSGEVRDHWSMPRSLPGIWGREERVRAEAGRIAVSHRIQGMAQGMIQNSMRWLRPRIWELRDEGVRWALQVHDEIILVVPENDDLIQRITGLVEEGLVSHSGVTLRVPVECETHVDRAWGGLKD